MTQADSSVSNKPPSKMKIMQINGQHKKAAMDNMCNDILELGIDCVLIQEPYISKKTGKIPGVPPNYIQYHKELF